MRAVLLGAAASIAAITLPSAPAQAQQFVSGQPFVNGTSIATGPFVQSPAFGVHRIAPRRAAVRRIRA